MLLPESRAGRAIRRFALGVVSIGVVTGGVACYPKAGPAPVTILQGSVTWAANKWPGTTESTLAAGRETFLAKCKDCHDYPDLTAIPDEDWPDIIERMGGKADLNEAQTKGVLQFVLAARHP